MTKVSKSPDRHTFQAENYVRRCKENDEEPSEDYLNLYKSAREQDEENIANPAWQQDNMEYDLRSTPWILEKVRSSDDYAQNLYAAMCNMQFIKHAVWPMLKDQRWSCSWRHAGGIVADMREEGDYIDWYCSGIRGGYDTSEPDPYPNFVAEGTVSDQIRADLLKLGWTAVEWNDEV